ncbi:MAG: hypothetical protein IKU34_04200 [Clostridia bacterium]|nr:hypothetical protein [Clostridia bacterium]
MKRIMAALLAVWLLLGASAALGELGFAEIAKENVNVRDSAGGKMLWQLNSPQSVYVFEEKTVGKYLWCHVSTYVGKNPKTGWIRGDMLRFLSDEFYDVVDVIAGETYVMGLRSDGTVAILGDDMPHAPCIETVRTWKNIREIGTRVCSAYGLTDKGVVRAVGLETNFDGMKASHIGEGYPYPMDAQGRFLYDEWTRVWEKNGNWKFWMGDDVLGDEAIASVIGEFITPEYILLKSGRAFVIEDAITQGRNVREVSSDVPYTDLAGKHEHAFALRQDGRVDVIASRCGDDGRGAGCAACADVKAWTDVVQIEASYEYVLGRKSDGTVLYVGKDDRIRRQVAKWTNVVDIAAAPECCIALFADGSVAMAGQHHEGYFR